MSQATAAPSLIPLDTAAHQSGDGNGCRATLDPIPPAVGLSTPVGPVSRRADLQRRPQRADACQVLPPTCVLKNKR